MLVMVEVGGDWSGSVMMAQETDSEHVFLE